MNTHGQVDAALACEDSDDFWAQIIVQAWWFYWGGHTAGLA